MDSCFATLAVLLSLLAAASCAPTRLSPLDDFEAVRNSSLMLNQAAKSAAEEARQLQPRIYKLPFAWMEAGDRCDPESLRSPSALQQCLGKIFTVLKSYQTVLEKLDCLGNWSAEVRKALEKLHENMNQCVDLGAQSSQQTVERNTLTFDPLNKDASCHYTMERLFSFSIFTARVFAVGNPARHTDGSTNTCS